MPDKVWLLSIPCFLSSSPRSYLGFCSSVDSCLLWLCLWSLREVHSWQMQVKLRREDLCLPYTLLNLPLLNLRESMVFHHGILIKNKNRYSFLVNVSISIRVSYICISGSVQGWPLCGLWAKHLSAWLRVWTNTHRLYPHLIMSKLDITRSF